MQIDWWTLALQTVNFLVVVWLLRRFLYQPVLKMIDERRERDRAAADEARTAREEADALRAEYEGKLARFEDERRARQADLHAAAQKDRDELLKAARKEADAFRAAAEADMAEARNKALASLQTDIVDLAGDLAAKVLAEVSGPPDEVLAAQLDALPGAQRARMMGDLADGGTLTVATAKPLNDDMQQQVRALLRGTFGDPVSVAFDVDADLLGGAVLKLPHGVLDASVTGRLAVASAALRDDGK